MLRIVIAGLMGIAVLCAASVVVIAWFTRSEAPHASGSGSRVEAAPPVLGAAPEPIPSAPARTPDAVVPTPTAKTAAPAALPVPPPAPAVHGSADPGLHAVVIQGRADEPAARGERKKTRRNVVTSARGRFLRAAHPALLAR